MFVVFLFFFEAILLEVLVSLETIKQQNTTVLQILQSGNSSGVPLYEPPDVGSLPLPLQSVQDLRSLEQRLCTEPELKKKMVRVKELISVKHEAHTNAPHTLCIHSFLKLILYL